MSQISVREAGDLILKLAHERLTVECFFTSASGVRASIRGLIEGATNADGVVLLAPGPVDDKMRDWMCFNPFERPCDFVYGDEREFPEESRHSFASRYGNTALLMHFRESGDRIILYFTI